MSLLYLAPVHFANTHALLDLVHFPFSLDFKVFVLLVDNSECVLDRKHLVRLVLFCMPVHAFHAHHFVLFFAEKHYDFLVNMAFS